MSKAYKPDTPYNVPMRLLIPLTATVKGVVKKTFPDPPYDDAPLFFGSFRSYGGTEVTSNDTYTIMNTAWIETWYRPDIKPDCEIYMCDTDEVFRVIGVPENIQMNNQYIKFKVQKVGGEA